MAATGWDGKSFAELAMMELEGKMVLIKIEDNEWEDLQLRARQYKAV